MQKDSNVQPAYTKQAILVKNGDKKGQNRISSVLEQSLEVDFLSKDRIHSDNTDAIWTICKNKHEKKQKIAHEGSRTRPLVDWFGYGIFVYTSPEHYHWAKEATPDQFSLPKRQNLRSLSTKKIFWSRFSFQISEKSESYESHRQFF